MRRKGVCNMDYRGILDRLSAAYADILGENFVGLYVHGSIALGCFHPVSSDIDFVCVVHTEPDDAAKLRLMNKTVALEPLASKKGLEMHVLRLADCLHPVHPVHFCLHYSGSHTESYRRDPQGYIRRMKGNDPDLAGHLTILHACGICWKGRPTAEVFGPVPGEMYLDSILDDVIPGCGGEVYRICNLCRVWGYLAEGLVLSKRTGPEWALQQAPEHASAIEQALACYNAGREWGSSEGGAAARAWLTQKIVSLLPESMADRYAPKE